MDCCAVRQNPILHPTIILEHGLRSETCFLTNGISVQRLFVRPLRRFCRARADVDLFRDLIDLSDARNVGLCDRVAGDRLAPVLFSVLARNRRPLALRDLGKDFFTGSRLGGLVETALARLKAKAVSDH